MRHLDDPDAESTATAVNGVYKLRDRLAHSALVAEGLDDQGWTVETRRRGVERSHQRAAVQSTSDIDNGSMNVIRPSDTPLSGPLFLGLLDGNEPIVARIGEAVDDVPEQPQRCAFSGDDPPKLREPPG